MARAKKQKAGKFSIADMRKIVNKKAGEEVFHDFLGQTQQKLKSGFRLVQGG